MDFLDGKFEISISNDCIKDKDSDVWNRITYTKRQIRLSELKELIIKQYAFCGVFENDVITQNEKYKHCWEYSYIIPIDLDNRKMPYDEFINIIEDSDIMPNMAYKTQNNGIKGNRYRLLYVFDEPIRNAKLYKQIYDGLIKEIERLTNERNKDNCGGVITQSFAGSNQSDNIFYCDLYNSIESVKKQFAIRTLNISDKHQRIAEAKASGKQQQIKQTRHNFDFSDYTLKYDEFAIDFNCMNILDIIEKYNNKYVNYEQTQLNSVSSDVPYILIPKDYTQIRRYWYLVDNDKRTNKDAHIRKICDGMQRRKKLFINAILRRLIYKEISFDNLLYNIICEFHYYMINNGNKIYRKDLFDIVKNAYNEDLSKWEHLREGNKEKTFIVNSEYCAKYGITKKSAVRKAMKEIKSNEIGLLYDCSLSDKENIRVMKDNGLKISLRTLKNWRKEHGITIYDKSAKTNYKEKERNIIHCNCTFEKSNNIEGVSKVDNLNNIEREEETYRTNMTKNETSLRTTKKTKNIIQTESISNVNHFSFI